MNRRRLELESHRAVERQRVEKMIGIDRLRRAGEAVDALRHERRGDDRRMQERAACPTTPCGSGTRLRSSSAGVPIAPAGRDEGARADRDAARRRPRAARVHREHIRARRRARRARMNAAARARVTSVAPRASAPGIVVTSIDCLALVGQPMPQ